tara:strand:- start:245 stop:985 length:741 start_codon:yes stop_codon:yes gene_type:complete
MFLINQNINLSSYIAVILTIIVALMMYNAFIKKDPVIEGMANVSGVTYEALQSLASMYNSGKLKVSELEVTGSSKLNGIVTCNNNLHVNGKSTLNNMVTCNNELKIINGGGAWGTHFNYQNKGETYIRGTVINLDKDNNKNGNIKINGNLTTLNNLHVNGNSRIIGNNDVDGTISFKQKVKLDIANPQGNGNVMKLICTDHTSNNLLIGPQNGGKGYHIALDGGDNYYFNAPGRRYGNNRDDGIWG